MRKILLKLRQNKITVEEAMFYINANYVSKKSVVNRRKESELKLDTIKIELSKLLRKIE